MDNKDSLYSTPAANLIAEQGLPEEYVDGELGKDKLRLAGWLAILYTLIQIPSFVLSFFSGAEPDNELYDSLFKVFTVVDMLLWIYLFLVFKKFVNLRFDYGGVNRVIQFIVVLSIIMYGLVFLMGQGDEELDIASLVYFILMIPLGVALILFGKRLLNIEAEFKYLRTYAWLNILLGISTATVVLLMLAVPLGVIASLLLAMLFFEAANEIKLSGKGQP